MEPARDIGASLWIASQVLSKRVQRLREEYFSWHERDHFRNEVLSFTTGESDDIVFSPHQWGVAPEVFIFSSSLQDTLSALATKVELPEGFWAEPLPVRRAMFFREVLSRHLPVRILEGELIVGSYFNTALSRTLNPEETKEWQRQEKNYKRKNLFMNVFGIGNCGAIPGHIIPDYPSVLQKGFSGLAREYEDMQRDAEPERRDFLRALIISCQSVPLFTERYAEEAERLAEGESGPGRRPELKEIARISRKVPWNPAGSFYEAVQALWFTHMLVMAAESYPGPGLSPGRIDQYLYPFYKKDIEAGELTRDKARELLQCYFIKHNYAYDYMGRVGPNQGINSGFGQLITIAGMGPGGADLTNDLTYLFLDVIEDMNMLEPKPNIRLHRRTPDELLDKVTGIITRTQGSPFLINFDEHAIQALGCENLPEDDLWDYAPVGCLENTMQGCDRSGTVDVNLNLSKAVELVLFNGRDQRLKWRIGKRTGNPERFKTFEEFFQAYKTQLASLIDRILESACRADAIRARFEPTPYLSTVVKGCAEKGRDVSAGGPVYNFITVEGVAFATAVDSLATVKKLVFDEKRISMKDLIKAIRNNFKGHEALRQMLINRAPKYGNDDDEADEIATELNRFWTERVFERTSPATGRRFRAGYLSWNYWILYASLTAATPDGRERGTYLSNGICPVTGVDHRGPTSVARSVWKVDHSFVPNGSSHTISFNPSLLRTEEGRDNLKAYLRAYGEQGGTCLQVNMVDPDTLREAQKNPEPYSNLLVRVTGYNAYFTKLGREMQDEIISREAFHLQAKES
jgi:pyruvate formate-lyase/glycerol dehydratase family glycyl radical enzyme